MEWGLFTCPYQRLPLEQAFADARALGYDYIELWGGRPHAYAYDLLSGDLADVQRLADRYAMPVRFYTPEHNAYPYNYMMGPERQWESAMNYLTAALRCGKLLGCQAVLLSVGHGGSAPEEARYDRLLRSLRHLVHQAETLRQPIVLEALTPYESNTCTRLSELEEVLREVDSPLLQGMCDVVAPFVQGEDPAEYPRRLGAAMAHLHLVDSDGVSETHLIPGDGVMDLGALLRDIRAAGYDSTATLELVTHYIDNPTDAARWALRRAKELMDA